MKTIREYFDKTGNSYDHFAEKYRISKSYMNRVVNDMVNCSLPCFLRFAKWVNMPQDEAAKEWSTRQHKRIDEQVKEINE